MRERWLPVGVLAVGLFAINVAARLVARLWFDAGPWPRLTASRC